jgi:Arc/MetJ-type ribon-helix-helix transcriptional regulator
MTITLPDSMVAEAQAKAKAAGFRSVDDYIAYLIVADEPESGEPDYPPGPPEITPRNRAELEAMLEAGMNSGPPIRVTPEFWEERRRVLAERMAKRRGEQP